MKPEGYYVWNPDANRPEERHKDFTAAIREAERLAAKHYGHRFIVLKAMGSAIVETPGKFMLAPGVDMDDEIPF